MQRYPDRGLHGRLVDDLGARIVAADIVPGAIIILDDIATLYGVSRTVVREALRVLAGKGLIEARPKRGTYARERKDWNLLDPDVLRWQFQVRTDPGLFDRLQEVRVMVEPAAAELAARRRTDSDLKELHSALDDMSAAGPSPEGIADADQRFHLGLISATHNDLMGQLSVVIGIGLSARDEFVHTHRISIKRGLQLHRDVAAAVAEQRADDARLRMLELLASAARDVDDAGRETLLPNSETSPLGA